MNNGRPGKGLAGMNAERGATLNGQRSGKSLDQLSEEPTPAAHPLLVGDLAEQRRIHDSYATTFGGS